VAINPYNAMAISHGSPYLTEEQQAQRLAGLEQQYLTSIMQLPQQAFAAMLPDAGYTPGELTSSPQDKFQGDMRHWAEYIAARKANEDYAKGAQLGEVASYVADPFFDIPGVAGARLASIANPSLKNLRGLNCQGSGLVVAIPLYLNQKLSSSASSSASISTLFSLIDLRI